MRHFLLASVAINAIRIVGFDSGTPNYMPPAMPGQANIGLIQSLVAAALSAANQNELPTTDIDLSARDMDSAYMLPYWDLTDDLVTGYDAVKARGDKYLPKFGDEPQLDYDARLKQTKMTNVYRDVVEALAGKPFEEEVTLTQKTDEATGDQIPLPSGIEDFLNDVDGAGNNITSFVAATFFNGINSAIDWIYVDYPKVDIAVVRSQQDLIDQNIRPFWSHVLGRNVLEATSQIINGKETLIKMRILEPGFPNNIRMFERTPDGAVTMGLFQEKLSADGKSKTFILIDSAPITIGVIPLVPFATGRRDGRTFRFFPVMRDAADLQIQLYQQESGLKFAKVMTAYPMLAANGMNPAKGPDGKPLKLAVGPNRVLYSSRDGGSGTYGTWNYVSPDAACLTYLSSDVKDTMDQLRELGRQPLTAQSGNLTVITTAYAAGKARTAVGAWVLRLKDALENAMKLTCLWLKIKEDNFEPDICIFDDFDDFSTDQASDLGALQFARTNKEISHENFIIELKRRNTIRPDMDDTENQRQLLNETPDDTVPPDALDDSGNPLPAPKDPANPQPGEAGYVDPNLKPGDPGYKPPAPGPKKPPIAPAKKPPVKKKVLA